MKIIALTIGDPGGTGPEVAVKAAAALGASDLLPILVGDGAVKQEAVSLCNPTLSVREIRDTDDIRFFPETLWALSDPALVLQVVATTLGLREHGPRPLREVLIDSLKPREVLLVLDNCEHLIEACARIADDLLRACPQLSILATSREVFHIAGETIHPVPPLTTPDPRHLPATAALTKFKAVQLFAERAVTVFPGFVITADNGPAVARVCHQLDGMPLAIELAAARLKTLSVEQITAHLDDRFRLLIDGHRTALPRQQTLSATIEWSYNLLARAERVLLKRLSIFAGSWSRQLELLRYSRN